MTWQGSFYIFLWIPACFEASFKVCKAPFKCCFRRVCPKQSFSFAFDKTSFYPRRVARAKMGIVLKGFLRNRRWVLLSFDVLGFFYESLSFEHHCIVSMKVISFSDISAVNCIIAGWNVLACSMKRSTSFLLQSQREKTSLNETFSFSWLGSVWWIKFVLL